MSEIVSHIILLFVILIVCCQSFLRYAKLAHNVLRIGDGGAFEKNQPTYLQKLNRITNAELINISPTIANTMLAVVSSSRSC